MQLRPYLSFQGDCADAIALYERAFGASVMEIMRFGDILGGGPPIPEEKKENIVQATLRFGEHFIRMSDAFKDLNAALSERIAIAVECTEEEVRRAFGVLSEEGTVDMPLQQTFFSPCYGIVVDKYGVMWNLAALT